MVVRETDNSGVGLHAYAVESCDDIWRWARSWCHVLTVESAKRSGMWRTWGGSPGPVFYFRRQRVGEPSESKWRDSFQERKPDRCFRPFFPLQRHSPPASRNSVAHRSGNEHTLNLVISTVDQRQRVTGETTPHEKIDDFGQRVGLGEQIWDLMD